MGQGFMAPVNTGAVAMRTSMASPVMFGGSSKAAPKKPVRKAVKKVVKKPVKKVAKKVVKKAPVKRAAVRKAGAKTNVGASAQSFSSKFISKENWAYQAFALLTKLPASKPRQADEGRA